MTAPSPAVAVGAVIDGFRLDEHLHQGGMAELWRVSRTGADASTMPLIMKLPRLRSGDEPAGIVGYEVEAMILPTLSGPHVPAFVAKGDFTRQPYIVMERLPGSSLLPRIADTPLPLAEVVDIGRRVAAALHELHRQHVVHLDVKPSNIMFRADGTAVLVDFGLSHHDHLPDLLDEELTVPVGTGPYLSPEQLQFVRKDPRSDLFALGVMLYFLATGTRPFGAPATIRGLRRRLYADPVPPRALRPEMPPWLQEIILRCLAVDPADRHQSAAQLALDLAEPDNVTLTERAERVARSPMHAQARRWLQSMRRPMAEVDTRTQLLRNPIVVAAVDIDAAAPELLHALREQTRRIVGAEPGCRLAAMCVLRPERRPLIATQDAPDGDERSARAQQFIALKHWTRPIAKVLQLDAERITCHVIAGDDAAEAIVEFARRCQADHIVIGARAESLLSRYLGSVSSQVVTQAPCSVTVVRAPIGSAGESPASAA